MDFALSFDKFSTAQYELQESILAKKQAKIDSFGRRLGEFRSDFEGLMRRHEEFVQSQQNLL